MRNKLLDNRPTSEAELLLIRVGQHLWRSGLRKEWPKKGVWLSLRDVFRAKEALRVKLREEWLESLKSRMRQMEAGKAAKAATREAKFQSPAQRPRARNASVLQKRGTGDRREYREHA